MSINKKCINVLFSILLASVISGCGGNGSKSSADINNDIRSSADSHAQNHHVKMGALIAFKNGMDDSKHLSR